MALFDKDFNLWSSIKDHWKKHAKPLTFWSDPITWITRKLMPSISGKYFGTNLTGAEREANAFTEQQNQEAMAFEERMADKQMAFQADQAATQWQRGVADMQAAGLNPALAYGQGGAQAMTGSSGAGHAGASVTPGVGSLSDLIQLATLPETKRIAKANASIAEEDAAVRGERNKAEISEITERVQNLIEEGNNMRYQRQVLWKSQAALNDAQADLARMQKMGYSLEMQERVWRNRFIKKWNLTPELAGELAKGIAIGGAAFISSVTRMALPKAGGR